MKAYSDYNETLNKGNVEVEVRIEGNNMRLAFDFEVMTFQEKQNGKLVTKKMMKYESIDVPNSRDYSSIVSAIVKDRYNDDEIQAVLANYAEAINTASVLTLLPEKKEEYLKEYADFQNWRSHAKEVAKKALTLI